MRLSIVTPRLQLSPLRPSDRDDVVAMLMDPGLYAFQGDRPDSSDEARGWVEGWLAGPSRRSGVCLHYVARLRDGGCLVGMAQATVRICPERAVGACVLGYLVVSRLHRQGFGTELVRAFVAELTAAVDPGELVALIRDGHVGSERIATSLGMRPTGDVTDGERVWRQQRPSSGGAPQPAQSELVTGPS